MGLPWNFLWYISWICLGTFKEYFLAFPWNFYWTFPGFALELSWNISWLSLRTFMEYFLDFFNIFHDFALTFSGSISLRICLGNFMEYRLVLFGTFIEFLSIDYKALLSIISEILLEFTSKLLLQLFSFFHKIKILAHSLQLNSLFRLNLLFEKRCFPKTRLPSTSQIPPFNHHLNFFTSFHQYSLFPCRSRCK